VVTFSQPPSASGDKETNDIFLSRLNLDAEAARMDDKAANDSGSEESDGDEKAGKGKEKAEQESLTKQSMEKVADAETKEVSTMTEEGKTENKTTKSSAPVQAKTRRRGRSAGTDAVIIFKEERVRMCQISYRVSDSFNQANTFHDFLKFVYPQYAYSCSSRICLWLTATVWNAQSLGTMLKASCIFHINSLYHRSSASA
jgi:hypothetical protein